MVWCVCVWRVSLSNFRHILTRLLQSVAVYSLTCVYCCFITQTHILYDSSAVSMCLLCTGGNYEDSSCASGSIDSSRTPNKARSKETPIKPLKPERPVRQGRTQHFFGLSSFTTEAIPAKPAPPQSV